MTLRPLALLALTLPATLPWAAGSIARDTLDVSGFAVERAVVVGATPDAAFDAFTGDIRGWWDHSFSAQPHALVLEAKVGGSFYELFDDAGNGAQHARVTLVRRGEEIQFRGPLGFQALGVNMEMVHRVRFEAEGEGKTRVSVSVRGVGEVQAGWPETVEKVWGHFLEERFQPFVEGRLGR